MAKVLTEKTVRFSGIWKPSSKSTHDALLKQISVQFLAKKSLVATYKFCTDGLRLLVVHDNGRQGPTSEKIPLSSIQDVCANRYNPICLMTIYTDAERRSNFLVCRCESEKDASEIVLTFREYKKSLDGEGYKINFVKPQGTNWTLMSKQADGVNGQHDMASGEAVVDGVRVNGNESFPLSEACANTFEREPCDVDGRHGFSIAVQTNFGEHDIDRVSMTSTSSFHSLKDELISLSQEIRAIKFLLEKSGISASEYLKRGNTSQSSDRSYVTVPMDEQELPSPTESPNGMDRRVNFDANFPHHDARSHGSQTESGKRGVYVKRQGRSEMRSAYSVKNGSRTRSHSSSSTPQSPSALSIAGANEVFEMPTAGQHQRVYIRGVDPRIKGGYTTTIERPIEQVYSMSKRVKNPRSTVVILPNGHHTMPMQRPSHHSHSSSSNDLNVHQHH